MRASFVLGAALAAAPVLAVSFPVDVTDPAAWTAAPSDGVTLGLSRGEAGALRLEVDFHGGGGYAVARRKVDLDLPANYVLSFTVRGDIPPNDLEVKLIDATGDNVWWRNLRDTVFTPQAAPVRIKKRQITFAWGPLGGGELRRVAAIEFAVTAGKGGKGWVEIGDLKIEERPEAKPYAGTPSATATASEAGHEAPLASDGDPSTEWRSGPAREAVYTLDFGEIREFGGLVLDWGEPHARTFRVDLSDDGASWRAAREVAGGGGGRRPLFLPDSECRFVRLVLKDPDGRGFALREIAVAPLEDGASLNAFFAAIARQAPRGSYPRGIAGAMEYWTVVGLDGDAEEALVGEDGAIETGRGGFSLEPFLIVDGKLVTWADVSIAPSLQDGYLPVPTVTWRAGDLALEITAAARGETGASWLLARYRLRNEGAVPRTVRLVVAARPFQVNPPSQFLGTPGGVAPAREIEILDDRVVVVDGRPVVAWRGPAATGAIPFDAGDVTALLRAGEFPAAKHVRDPFGHASAAMAWDFDVAPGGADETALSFPLTGIAAALAAEKRNRERPGLPGGVTPAVVARSRAETEIAGAAAWWRNALSGFDLRLPPGAPPLASLVRSNLAWILIHRDGPKIQPGSRSYARSWIRDGALTSTGLLRLGHGDEVREFLNWFARFQYLDGKVPCCVDERGADPVPENDSHGEMIYAVAEYWRYTRDRAFAESMWPHVKAAADYIDSLRRKRRTPEYAAPEKAAYFGLLPESISHEGYSDKPVHSYWDDFFAYRGLEDAVALAAALGKEPERVRLAAIRDEFKRDLLASIARTIADHGITWIPGCAEKGDFDPTSTTVALEPGGLERDLPQDPLRGTFERYWSEFTARRDGTKAWENYTPYEWRNVGALVRLGWRERALEAIDFLLNDRRPLAWNAWAEVVWRDPRTPKFVGDIPHGWVASDFIRSALDLFAYDRDSDHALVLAAGVPQRWIDAPGGVGVSIPSRYGPLSYKIQRRGEAVRMTIAGGLTVPPGGLVVRPPGVDREIVIRKTPAKLEWVPGTGLR